MLRKGHILAICVASVSIVTVLSIEAQQDYSIPSWVKNTALWWGQGDISDADFVSAMKFLIEQNVLQISTTQDSGDMQVLENDVLRLSKENQRLQGDMSVLEKDISRLTRENAVLYDDYIFYYNLYYSTDNSYSDYQEPQINPEDYCYGYADCFVGSVTKIIDGDTIEVDGQSIRFALVNAPEIGKYGGTSAKNFVESVCPIGSTALVDEDDGQTRGSYGRTIAVVYCQDTSSSLNELVIASGYAIIDTPYCSNSEFGDHYWALLYGCRYEEPSQYNAPKSGSSTTTQSCDPSYPDFCIPPPPPDLNCSDISQKRFTVYQPDPHHFDGDKDGIGCES